MNVLDLENLLSQNHFLPIDEYKELDELMAYILNELIGSSDKELIREAIIAYTELWHRKQNIVVLKMIKN